MKKRYCVYQSGKLQAVYIPLDSVIQRYIQNNIDSGLNDTCIIILQPCPGTISSSNRHSYNQISRGIL